MDRPNRAVAVTTCCTAAMLDTATLESADCVLVLSKHDDVNYSAIAQHARVVVDTRDALSANIRANARARIVHL